MEVVKKKTQGKLRGISGIGVYVSNDVFLLFFFLIWMHFFVEKTDFILFKRIKLNSMLA